MNRYYCFLSKSWFDLDLKTFSTQLHQAASKGDNFALT